MIGFLLLLLITTERAIRYVRKPRINRIVYIEYRYMHTHICHSTKSIKAKTPKVRFDKITGLEFIMCHELTDFNSIFSLYPRSNYTEMPFFLILSRKRNYGENFVFSSFFFSSFSRSEKWREIFTCKYTLNWRNANIVKCVSQPRRRFRGQKNR